MKKNITNAQLHSAVHEVATMAHITKPEAMELYAKFAEKIGDPLEERQPNGRRKHSERTAGFAQGLIYLEIQNIWHEHIEFVYKNEQGVLFSTHKQSTFRRTEEYFSSNRGHELGDLPCAHVWRGTEKLWTPWSK